LVFKHAFPVTTVIQDVIKECLSDAAKILMTHDGHYNALAGSVRQCFQLDDEYRSKMIRLVSGIMSSTTQLNIFSAARTDSHLPREDQGALCTNRSATIYWPPIKSACNGICGNSTQAV
jgi:hypothetical protein